MTHLFVYGTLMSSVNNNMSHFLQANAHLIGNAYINGKLYEVGGYPGAVIGSNPLDHVHGQLFKIINTETLFMVLDEYEGIGDGNPADYEYVRTQVMAYLEDGNTLNAWCYTYNFSIDTFQLISSGRYCS